MQIYHQPTTNLYQDDFEEVVSRQWSSLVGGWSRTGVGRPPLPRAPLLPSHPQQEAHLGDLCCSFQNMGELEEAQTRDSPLSQQFPPCTLCPQLCLFSSSDRCCCCCRCYYYCCYYCCCYSIAKIKSNSRPSPE